RDFEGSNYRHKNCKYARPSKRESIKWKWICKEHGEVQIYLNIIRQTVHCVYCGKPVERKKN
ncbi:MAG: hypothetical protein PVG65_03335, partial [Candidatus Thorarchaeota archaeon]